MKAIDRSLGNVCELFGVGVGFIVLKHGDNLVVCFSTIDHAEAADGACVKDDVAVEDWARGEDADVHGVAVSDDVLLARRLSAKLSDAVTAEGAGDEPIEVGAVI